jgi:hypothetical protein
MSETPQYEVGQVVDGRRWTGSDWEPAPGTDPVTQEQVAPEPVLPAPMAGTDPATQGSTIAEPLAATTTSAAPSPDAAAYWAPADGTTTVAGPSPARAAAPMFFAGVVVAIGVSIAGIVVVNSRGGGILWWGGYFVAFGLFRAAKARYDAASRATGAPMSSATKTIAVVGLVVALGSAAAFGLTWAKVASTPPLAETVGSCWQEQDGKGVVVDCTSSDAQYTAIATAATKDACPEAAVAWVQSAKGDSYLCLATK